AFGLAARQPLLIGLPVGSVVAFAGSLSAADTYRTDLRLFTWRACDGAVLSRLEFPDLFKAIGYTYGGADDSFCLPDYAGYFFRALATSAAQDPGIDDRDPASPNARKQGIGSTQKDALQDHVHPHGGTLSKSLTAQPGGPAMLDPTDTGGPATAPGKAQISVSPDETRPRNVYVNWIIKVAYTRAERA
ncbi:tail fiber protein, partial [Thioclava sp. BHET1]